jgi:hypothetical protein
MLHIHRFRAWVGWAFGIQVSGRLLFIRGGNRGEWWLLAMMMMRSPFLWLSKIMSRRNIHQSACSDITNNQDAPVSLQGNSTHKLRSGIKNSVEIETAMQTNKMAKTIKWNVKWANSLGQQE